MSNVNHWPPAAFSDFLSRASSSWVQLFYLSNQLGKALIRFGAADANTSCCLPFGRGRGLGYRKLTQHLSSVHCQTLAINLDTNRQKELKKQQETKRSNKKHRHPLSAEHQGFLQANVSWDWFSVDVENWGWGIKSAELSNVFKKP